MNVLGLAAWFHDSSAALLRDGELVAGRQEERFNRDKHTNVYPQAALDWVLGFSGLSLDQVDEVAFYVNPRRYLWTGLKAVAAHFPSSLRLARSNAATMSPLVRFAHIARLRSILRRRHRAEGSFKVVYVDHYRTHQASTFLASGFDDAAVLTMDFAVDGTTEVIAHGRDRVIEANSSTGFRTASRSSMRLSRTSWDSSFTTNTRSWAWRPSASRDTSTRSGSCTRSTTRQAN